MNLEKTGIKILTLTDVGVEKDPEETGATFQENAKLKAKYYGDFNKPANYRR